MRIGGSEHDAAWRVGHPILFPNTLRVGWTFQFRVPMDDRHTWHLMYQVLPPPPGAEPTQERIPLSPIPLLDERGEHITDFVLGQDMTAWVTQGPIAERDRGGWPDARELRQGRHPAVGPRPLHLRRGGPARGALSTEDTGREAVVGEMYDAAVHDHLPAHGGRWGKSTLEVCLAVLAAARERREVFLSHQTAPRPGPTPRK
jgi:hypothetical protein